MTYAESNAILFDVMEYFSARNRQVSEVDMSVIRILEALKFNKYIAWEQAFELALNPGLEEYLDQL